MSSVAVSVCVADHLWTLFAVCFVAELTTELFPLQAKEAAKMEAFRKQMGITAGSKFTIKPR